VASHEVSSACVLAAHSINCMTAQLHTAWCMHTITDLMSVAGGEQLVIKARALLVVSVVVPAVLCWAMLLGDDRARYYGVLVPLAIPVGAVFVAVSAAQNSTSTPTHSTRVQLTHTHTHTHTHTLRAACVVPRTLSHIRAADVRASSCLIDSAIDSNEVCLCAFTQ
jgi:hypothetical protein